MKKLLRGQVYEDLKEDEEEVQKDVPVPTKNPKEEGDGQSRLEKNLLQWTDFTKMDLRKKEEGQ